MEKKNETLKKALLAAGKEHGYRKVDAEFVAFRDFKVKWTRSYDWIAFQVSDYLTDAPEDVLETMGRTIIKKISGEEPDADYDKNMIDWITSSDFVAKNQPTYLRRYRGISNSTEGFHIDLQESYKRLVAKGLIEKDEEIAVRWMEPRERNLGTASVLLKTVLISRLLDCDSVTDNLIDFELYSKLCHVGIGYRTMNSEDRMEELLEKYPGRKAAMEEAARLGFTI